MLLLDLYFSSSSGTQRQNVCPQNEQGMMTFSACILCDAGSSCCGAVALRVTAALLGRFLPKLGPLAMGRRPFFLRLDPPPGRLRRPPSLSGRDWSLGASFRRGA